MNSRHSLICFVWLLISCSGDSKSLRFRAVQSDNATAAVPGLPVPWATPVFQATQADLRPLSKVEIRNSLQDIFLLPTPPELDGFLEQSSKSQIFRNSYEILNDSSSLTGLSRDMSTLLESLDIRLLASKLTTCDAMDSAECRMQLLTRVATHAWRRPLTSEERSILEKQATDTLQLPSGMQDRGLAHAMAQVVFDPRFLFRSELGSDDAKADAQYALASWEKLAALTYGLTQRPPSYEQIQNLAEFSKDPERWNQTIDSLIDSPQMAAALANMISEWLMYYGLEHMDIQGDPNWTKDKAQDMVAAAQRFVGESLAQDDSLRALITRRNPDNEGAGIFSSKAFLTSTSKNGRGSMIMRGVRIIRQALCQPMGVPPGTLEAAAPKDLSPLDPNYDIKLNLVHGARADCTSCHKQIDPAGLALHTFDGFGSNLNSQVDFRALNIPSEVAVALNGQINKIATGSVQEFTSSLANSSVFTSCFSRQALRNILGRDLTEQEIASAELLADYHLRGDALQKESLKEFFRVIVSSEQIYMRTR